MDKFPNFKKDYLDAHNHTYGLFKVTIELFLWTGYASIFFPLWLIQGNFLQKFNENSKNTYTHIRSSYEEWKQSMQPVLNFMFLIQDTYIVLTENSGISKEAFYNELAHIHTLVERGRSQGLPIHPQELTKPYSLAILIYYYAVETTRAQYNSFIEHGFATLYENSLSLAFDVIIPIPTFIVAIHKISKIAHEEGFDKLIKHTQNQTWKDITIQYYLLEQEAYQHAQDNLYKFYKHLDVVIKSLEKGLNPFKTNEKTPNVATMMLVTNPKDFKKLAIASYHKKIKIPPRYGLALARLALKFDKQTSRIILAMIDKNMQEVYYGYDYALLKNHKLWPSKNKEPHKKLDSHDLVNKDQNQFPIANN